MTVTEHLRASLLSRIPKRVPDLDSLRLSERCPEFERLRQNRLVMGAIRYGLLGDKSKPQYDRASCMIRRLNAYGEDKNAEHLVDVANLAMLEFVEGNHSGVLSKDDGEHTRVK